MADLIDRLADKFEILPNGCWQWIAATRPGRASTYGVIHSGSLREGTRRSEQAHRAMWVAVVEPLPSGLELDHLCLNGLCVNPDHLEPVAPKVNKLRADGFAGINARKAKCSRGHKFDAANTRIDYRGHRRCRTCDRITRRARADESGA